jgi:arabinogalactan endo-1,4-beta-galactosidase
MNLGSEYYWREALIMTFTRFKNLKLLILFILVSTIVGSSAGTMNIYVEDWGTYNGGAALVTNGDLGLVGWTGVAVSQTAGPYLGIYQAAGASDAGTGAALPVNTVYLTSLLPNQSSAGMFYTTSSAGAGTGGDSAFTAIDPAQYTNLTLSVEVREQTFGARSTNYFAVQVGGLWYVAANNPLPVYTGAYPTFTNATMLYTNLASVWNNLTIGSTSVTIGSIAGTNLSGPITGIGIVELPTTDGFNYNQLAISAFTNSAQATAANFLAAADFSDLAFFESRGVTYKDGGQVQDGVQIFKNHGINCVRLRLWTSSASQASSDPYNYINNTTYTVPLAVRVKNAGLLFSLDFHYSDTWTDPGHQATPSAWSSLNFAQLLQQMRSYNSNTIVTFAAAGAMPDYVQIGNEITDGMLWTNGQLSGTWGTSNPSWIRLGQLMNAAIQGIKDATNATGATMPKIIVHIDRGGDWATTKSFFDNLNAQGVPFDIIGESYYPFYQGSPTNLNTCLSNAAIRYGKPIIVAEDAFPYTNTCPSAWLTNLFGYPPTPAGQVSFVAAIGQIIRNVPNGLGLGYFYWGTEYQAANGVNEAGYNTASFFDQNGNLLPVANAVGSMGAPFILTQPTNAFVLAGGNAAFSATVLGAAPLVYQWEQSGTNLANGAGISGANTTNLTLTGVTSNSTTNYTLVITNVYGSVTSSVAVLTLLVPSTISTPLTNQIVECGSNATFAIIASGTPPLNYQWSLDGTTVSGATNSSFTLTNTTLPSHAVSIVVSNLYASATNDAILTVQDTTPPVITLVGGNPIYLNLGSTFTDPGAVANDKCAGSENVVVGGKVNLNSVGTNTLTYTADDGNGNTNAITRSVIVSDLTPIIGSVAANRDGSFTLDLSGAPGNTYVLETATNLPSVITWQPIATNLIDNSGVWQFTDTQAVNFQQQFYRLVLAQ